MLFDQLIFFFEALLFAQHFLLKFCNVEFISFDDRVILLRQLIDFAIVISLPFDFIGLQGQNLLFSSLYFVPQTLNLLLIDPYFFFLFLLNLFKPFDLVCKSFNFS